MSTDLFEGTLRDLLRDTADAAEPDYLEPDAQQVIGVGRRVVRRRRYAACLVAASIAGIVGVAAMGPGAARTSTPADTISTSTWVSGQAKADLTRTASMGPHWGPADLAPSVRVVVDADRKIVTGSLLGADGTTSNSQSAPLPMDSRASTWVPSTTPGLEQGVLPAAAKDVVFLWAGQPDAGNHVLASLSGTPYKAFATWVEPDPDGPTPLRGLIWTDGTTVYDTHGDKVRGVRDGSAMAFVDRNQGVLGIFEDGTSSTALLGDSDVPSIMMSRVQAGSDTMKTTALLVLPAGAREVSITTSDGATVTAAQTHGGGPSGDTLVVARIDAPAGLDHGVEGATWTNADGSQGWGTVSAE